jgi:hypothetical protein
MEALTMNKKTLNELANIIKDIPCKESKKQVYESIGKLAYRINPKFSWIKWNSAIYPE